MARLVSILLYVVTGFFFSGAVFIGLPGEIPLMGRCAMTSIFAVLGLIAFGLGAACAWDGMWKRDLGLVCIVSAAVVLFEAFTFVCMYETPGIEQIEPRFRQSLGKLNDFATSGCFAALLGAIGVVALVASKRGSQSAAGADVRCSQGAIKTD
jgi:hypothetical protein